MIFRLLPFIALCLCIWPLDSALCQPDKTGKIEVIASPNRQYSIVYSIAGLSNPYISQTAAFKKGNTTFWSYTSNTDSRGLQFYWSPSSKSVFMCQCINDSGMECWLVQVTDFFHVTELQLGWIDDKLVNEMKKIAPEASTSTIQIISVKWISSTKCSLKYLCHQNPAGYQPSANVMATLLLDTAKNPLGFQILDINTDTTVPSK